MVGYCRRCRKHSYLSEHHAAHVAAHVHERRGRQLWTYLCPHRYGWHLTHKPPRRRA